jgi:hypothetical protein
MADDDDKDTMGWRVDARVTERVRAIARREGRRVQDQAERIMRAGLVALGEGDPMAPQEAA